MIKREEKKGKIVEVVHEPGNMTRYQVIACEYRKGHWMVSLPHWRVCLEVLEGSCIHFGYVQEKFVFTRALGDIDASEIAKAIAAAVPKCTAEGCTDASGKKIRSNA